MLLMVDNHRLFEGGTDNIIIHCIVLADSHVDILYCFDGDVYGCGQISASGHVGLRHDDVALGVIVQMAHIVETDQSGSIAARASRLIVMSG